MIKDYNDGNIKTLTSLEHIRFRPSMYIKSPATVDAQVQLVKEILDNTTDEVKNFDKNRKFVTEVGIFVGKDNYQVVVIDHGRGVPVGAMDRAYTVNNTSGKYDTGGAYQKTTGTNGVGIKATTALSDRFIAISKRINGFGFLETRQGKIVTFEKYETPDLDTNTIGTTVVFEPDFSILTDKTGFVQGEGIELVCKLAQFIAVFSNNQIIIRQFNKLIPNSVLKDKDRINMWNKLRELTTTGGEIIYDATTDTNLDVVDYVTERFRLGRVEWGPIHLKHDEAKDRTGFDITLFGTKECRKGNGGLFGAVNLTEITTNNASHLTVLNRLVKNMLSGYIANDDVRAYFVNTYRVPLCGAVMAEYDGAMYENQTKDNFRDTDFEKQYERLLQPQLNRIPEVRWEELYELIQQDIADRFNRYSNAEYRTGKSLKNAEWQTSREGVFDNCSSNNPAERELFICEGDSAGSQIANVRNTYNQAVFRLKGKPINGARTDTRKMTSNLIMADLISIINVKPSSQNLDDMHFSKLIIATDADADGHHIGCLTLTNLMKLNPLIVESGRVWVALPPLYALKSKSPLFIRDEQAFMDARVMLYSKLLKIDMVMGERRVTLHGEKLRDFCYIVFKVAELLSDISRTLVLDEDYLELLVHCVEFLKPGHIDTEKIKEKLGLDSATYYKDSDTLILVHSGMEIAIPVTGMTTEIQKYLLPLLEQIAWESYTIEISTRMTNEYKRYPVTFWDLWNFFRAIDRELSVRRFKGLGEMPDPQLEFTTVNPLTRCMIQIKSIGDLDVIYSMMGVDTNARKGLIDMGLLSDDDDLLISED